MIHTQTPTPPLLPKIEIEKNTRVAMTDGDLFISFD
jgi:hypothetical protein